MTRAPREGQGPSNDLYWARCESPTSFQSSLPPFYTRETGSLRGWSPLSYIFLLTILQHSRLYCFKGPNKWDGGLQSYYQYTKLLYILTLPSHQNNLERCKNFWTKICIDRVSIIPTPHMCLKSIQRNLRLYVSHNHTLMESKFCLWTIKLVQQNVTHICFA